MIEIKAKTLRADCAIYATGERVECVIEFINKAVDGEESGAHLENLAWASVQLHCYCKTTGPEKPTSSTTDLAELVGKTALDAVTQSSGDIIIVTKPKILFCDLKLKPSESKTYFFNEVIPRDGPPTYRGQDIKYFYKITIATQRVKSKVQTLTVPIRVIPIPIIARPDELPSTETNEDLAPTNPFLEKREVTELEISWHHLNNVTARRRPKFYRISNKRGFIGKFCLFKADYKLGEDIVGSVDFANCTVRCVQFSVKLQCEEIILNFVNQTKAENDTSSVNSSTDMNSVEGSISGEHSQKSISSATTEEPSGKISTFATNHEFCYCMLQTYISIPIPLHITPTFKTNLVDVRWRLHFEFVTTTMMDFGQPNEESGVLNAPAEIPVETMMWNLPITLYAANPLKIFSPSPDSTLIIK